MNLHSGTERFLSTVGPMRELVPLFGLVTISAGWATRTQILAGPDLPMFRSVVGGLLWGCLYLGLVLAYNKAAGETVSSGKLWRKLALSLLLGLASTSLSKLVLASLFAPEIWDKFFYMRRLLPPAFVLVWTAALMPRQTRRLIHVAATHPPITPLGQLAVLVFVAAILVSCADLVFEWGRGTAVEDFLKRQVIRQPAWTTNVIILSAIYALVFAVTRRLASTMMLVSSPYVLLVVASLAKIRYMHSAVQPLDLIRIPEFLPLFPRFFGTGSVVLAVALLGVWAATLLLMWRTHTCPMSSLRRWTVSGVSLLVLVAVSFPLSAVAGPSVSPKLRRFGIAGWEFRERARESGVLLSFLSEIREAVVSPPPNYSQAAVAGTLRKYTTAPAADPHSHRINLILYLVESLMDPYDLGFHYSYDPIPTIRRLRQVSPGGYVIVPEEFGGSANTEFEALTGLPMCFLPRWSLPYRQYLLRPVPSLPGLLKQMGYTTTAIQPDPRYFFNRERAYRLLGFDRVAWLDDVPGIERAPGSTWPSDETVVQSVIQESRQSRPSFIFAFPSSTHSPYNGNIYRKSDLYVLDPAPADTVGEVREYVNALHVADQAIGKLIAYFEHQPDSTVIAIAGDHLPPLSEPALAPYLARLAQFSGDSQFLWRRRVPLVVWANFALPKDETEFTISALPGYLLTKMKIPPCYVGAESQLQRRVA
jgi:Sulfatase